MPQAVVDSVELYETYAIGDGPEAIRETADGYIVVQPRVARTGIQMYLGRELGRPDLETVRVYRPESTVFHRDALASLAHRPITLGHPRGTMVNAKNWKQFAIGMSGDEVVRDGHAVRVPMTIMDAASFHSTTAREVSVGYMTEIAYKAGVTDSGEEYDAVQQKIRANHIAIVPQARGGSRLRLGDSKQGDHDMVDRAQLDRSFTVDGIEVTMPDMAGSVVQRTISRMNDETVKLRDEAAKNSTALVTVQKALDEATKTIAAKDGEIVVLKKAVEDSKLTPDLLDKAVAARQAVVDAAKRILGDTYTGQGKTEAQMKREAVDKHLGDKASSVADGMVDGAFVAITAGLAAAAPVYNGTRTLADALSTPRAQVADSAKLLAERDAALTKAWAVPLPGAAQ